MRTCAFAVVILWSALACTLAREQSAAHQPQDEEHNSAVSGVVVNERGQPMAGTRLSALSRDRPLGTGRRFVESDQAGRFRLGYLAWGEYSICARKEADGYMEICSNIFRKDGAPTATVSAKAPNVDVLVVIGPKAGTVTGTITDASTGAPLSAELRIRPTSSDRFVEQSVGSQFNSLIPPDADLDLEIRAPGYQLWRSSVDNYQAGKPFRMKSEEKRTLEVRLWPDPH
jgi:hypothetical protein